MMTPPAVTKARGRAALRVLVVPGLNNSGVLHWQSWLEAQFTGALRVHQADWARADLLRWSGRIVETIAHEPADWIAVAHSFGCLALARQLAAAPGRIRAALFVAPAEPAKFGLASQLPHRELPLPTTMIVSETDPWMNIGEARRWAGRWGSRVVNLGDAGHINVESGHGPLPQAKAIVDLALRSAEPESTRAREPLPALPG